MPQIKLVVNDI